jgi:hypothetical protein
LATTNPFRQRLRKRDVAFHTVVRLANESGKDSSGGNTDLALSDDFLWIAYDFSIPLQWLTSVETLGPGFLVAWDNPLKNVREAATFCVRRFFGYDLKKRDDIVARVDRARAAAEQRPAPAILSSPAASRSCESCGDRDARAYDFQWVFTFAMVFLTKPDRRTLCAAHARWRLLLNAASNLVLGTFGFGVFVAPAATFSATRQLYRAKALPFAAAAIVATIALIPYMLILYLAGWGIWEGIKAALGR